jgi:ribose transport system substrate-binding protein
MTIEDASRMSARLRRLLTLAALMLIAALIAAGCGSSDSKSSSSSSSTAEATEPEVGSDNLQVAEEELAPHFELPKSIGLTEPLTELPKGSTVAYLQCAIVNCQEHAESLEDAFAELGIKLQIVDSGLSPEEFSNAFAKVEQLAPDGVIYDAIPASIAQAPVEKLAGEGVPVVAISSPDLTLGKGIYNIKGVGFYTELGAMMANWVIVDSKGKAKVLYLKDPTLAFGEPETDALLKTFASNCEDCEVGTITTSSAAAGKALPGEVSGYLQKHPDTEYVVGQYSALFVGVPSALEVAGLDGVKLVGFAPTQVNQEYLAAGEEAADVMQSNEALTWWAADTMARALVGDPISSEATDNPPITQIVTPETVDWDPAKEDWPYIPGWQEQFIELWRGE